MIILNHSALRMGNGVGCSIDDVLAKISVVCDWV